MGSALSWLCCGCCPKPKKLTPKPKDKLPSQPNASENTEESLVGKSSSMVKTMTGFPINKRIKRKFVSKAELDRRKKKLEWKWSLIFEKPYNNFTQITDNLYLTGAGGIHRENIEHFNIKCIIQLTYELPELRVPGITCIRVPVDDSYKENISIYFDELSDIINSMNKKNIKTVVHCLGGICRSATIVIAYLMKYQKMSLKESFAYVKQRRDVIRPNDSFFRQLIEYEKKLFGKTLTKTIEITDRYRIKRTVPDFLATEYPDASTPSDVSTTEQTVTDPSYLSLATESLKD